MPDRSCQKANSTYKRGAECDGPCNEATERKEEDISNARKARGETKGEKSNARGRASTTIDRGKRRRLHSDSECSSISLAFVSSIGMCLALFHPIRCGTVMIP